MRIPTRYKVSSNNIEEIDSHLLIQSEDFMYGLDVENFIYKLDTKETITLLFLAMGYKPKEIKTILGYKNVNSIGKIVMKMKGVFKKEYFKN